MTPSRTSSPAPSHTSKQAAGSVSPRLQQYLKSLRESPNPLPSRIYLEANDDPHYVIDQLMPKFEEELEEYHHTALQAFYRRDTRFDDEEEHHQPTFPIITRNKQRSGHKRYGYLTLPNGQQVRKLNTFPYPTFSVETLCGVQEVMTYADALNRFSGPRTSHQCPRCFGYHLPPKPAEHTPRSSTSTTPSASTMECPKCHHQGNCLFNPEPDTIQCFLCGYRAFQAIPTLSEDEEHSNYEAVARHLDDWSWHLPPQEASTDDFESSLEETYDENNLSLDGADEETDSSTDSSIDALHTWLPYGWHLQDSLPVEDVREWLQNFADGLHAPAYRLFQQRSPLRQAWLNTTLLDPEPSSRHMAELTAAGHWFQHTFASPDNLQSQQIMAWLEALSTHDLEFFALDPEHSPSQHAEMAIDWFEPPTQWLNPLIQAITRRYTNRYKTPTLIPYLAKHFGLSEDVIRTIVTRPHTPEPTPSAKTSQLAHVA